MRDKLEVLERGSDMALAAHFTPLGSRLIVKTVEMVRFEPPGRVAFRLLRGPVPHLTETFELRAPDDGTELEYRGEIGTDPWALGSWWAALVAAPMGARSRAIAVLDPGGAPLRERVLDVDPMYNCASLAVLGEIVGARVFYLCEHHPGTLLVPGRLFSKPRLTVDGRGQRGPARHRDRRPDRHRPPQRSRRNR